MEQRKTTVIELKKRFSVYKLCQYAEVARSCIYIKQKLKIIKSPGRPPPGFTINRDGEIIEDKKIITILKEYRAEIEFANGGGARKLTHYLAIEKQIYINHKKIYRLCDENNLLLFKHGAKNKKLFKKNICNNSAVTGPNQMWQFDLKYIWIHGENRWCFFLGFIDVYTKKITGWYVGKSCKAGDLVFTLNQAIKSENISSESPLTT